MAAAGVGPLGGVSTAGAMRAAAVALDEAGPRVADGVAVAGGRVGDAVGGTGISVAVAAFVAVMVGGTGEFVGVAVAGGVAGGRVALGDGVLPADGVAATEAVAVSAGVRTIAVAGRESASEGACTGRGTQAAPSRIAANASASKRDVFTRHRYLGRRLRPRPSAGRLRLSRRNPAGQGARAYRPEHTGHTFTQGCAWKGAREDLVPPSIQRSVWAQVLRVELAKLAGHDLVDVSAEPSDVALGASPQELGVGGQPH